MIPQVRTLTAPPKTGFNPQHSHGSSQLSVTPVPGDPTSPGMPAGKTPMHIKEDVHTCRLAHTCIHTLNTYMCKSHNNTHTQMHTSTHTYTHANIHTQIKNTVGFEFFSVTSAT